jgi:hypothetical protein
LVFSARDGDASVGAEKLRDFETVPRKGSSSLNRFSRIYEASVSTIRLVLCTRGRDEVASLLEAWWSEVARPFEVDLSQWSWSFDNAVEARALDLMMSLRRSTEAAEEEEGGAVLVMTRRRDGPCPVPGASTTREAVEVDAAVEVEALCSLRLFNVSARASMNPEVR